MMKSVKYNFQFCADELIGNYQLDLLAVIDAILSEMEKNKNPKAKVLVEKVKKFIKLDFDVQTKDECSKLIEDMKSI